EIPQQVGTNIRRLTVVTPTGVSSSGASMSAPITPSTPTTFETRKVGTTIEMEPIISGDGREVELLITPKVTQFEGFIDYGSDIDNVMQMGDSQFNQPVDNRIIQPIFRTNTVTTGVKVYDGATVVLAGVKREDRINVKDKVPVIGDIPLVGRFWKSNVDRVQIKNFVVFVTVEVLDPAGQRINQAAGSGTEQAALSP
ncbi:MAG: type II and III secretion system protein, partial [Verrucomicrobiales bacterium]|nr:type II and III secretion system protein [Verrucomicrobiales bacterium]